jgi:putative phosphoribosyl transferase
MDSSTVTIWNDTPVRVPVGLDTLEGNLTVPRGARAVVLFAHGSGSSRHSRRNRFVAQVMQEMGLATLLMDLLTVQEESVDVATGQHRFDIGRLAARLVAATDWLARAGPTGHLAVGYFGASTGAAAALVAAAERQRTVKAVVSRGGRPDLAGEALGRVQAPTLLLVGCLDGVVIDLNREALDRLATPRKHLELIPGAGHLFEEPGKLEQVAGYAGDWFKRYLTPATVPAPF